MQGFVCLNLTKTKIIYAARQMDISPQTNTSTLSEDSTSTPDSGKSLTQSLPNHLFLVLLFPYKI